MRVFARAPTTQRENTFASAEGASGENLEGFASNLTRKMKKFDL